MMLNRDFFTQDALLLAPALIGKILVRRLPDGTEKRLRITETEAYRGTDDTACHAHRGKTARTEVLWQRGGTIYVYLCYGMHNMLNIVSGSEGEAQAVLIRCCEGFAGPGKLTKQLGIDRSFNRTDILENAELALEDDGAKVDIITLPRVGIAYADEKDRNALWRFKLK